MSQSPTNLASPPSPWDYRAPNGYHDEMVTATGERREHWTPFLDAMKSMGATEFNLRWQEGRRILQANGVTYNVYGQPDGLDRPWDLDAVPFLIGPDDWRKIEAAIIQRATLLNTILADLYGSQKLLQEKLVPPELVFAHPGFLRPCHSDELAQRVYLHLYAADLVRSPNGQWWVMGDRTQTPSGSGYALENRIVLSRMLPDVFADCRVRRLNLYFQAVREMLVGSAKTHRDNPRIVLWTPGPYNETYFEHAYLARYLGITLVEGGDLTVRDRAVFLKTLSGLLPVDVILRRLDDSFCDPLELRHDSTLGVPGLVQAVRAGNVAIVNSLGSGLLDTPAMAAFLPNICKHLFKEELKFPSVATWWGGQEQPLSYILDHLDKLVIKPALLSSRNQSLFPGKLSKESRAELTSRMKSAPHQFVGQEPVQLATAPIWRDGKLAPRHWMLRVYAVAAQGTYRVMPGGLTRVSAALDTSEVSMQRGGGSKDAWVIADGPLPAYTPMRGPTRPIDVNRASFDLPSRIADNLYWLGRYVQRVESSVRVMRTALNRFSDEWGMTLTPAVNAALTVLIRCEMFRPEILSAPPEIQADAIQHELIAAIFDAKRAGSIIGDVERVHRLAWLVRDRISKDSWNVLNQLDQAFQQPPLPEPLEVTGTLELLDQAIVNLMAFNGLVVESMTRSQGWRFLDIGRRMEWAIQKVERLYACLVAPAEHEPEVLALLLEIADSSMTYRSRYLTSMQPKLVLDLLMIDEANPRSLAYQLRQLDEHIEKLPYRPSEARRTLESRLALGSLTSVRLADIDELAKLDEEGRRSNLESLLLQLADDLPELSNALTRSYLTYAVPFRSLQTIWTGTPS